MEDNTKNQDGQFIHGEEFVERRTLKEMLLYKMDRSIAVIGVVGIAMAAILFSPEDAKMPIVTGCITVLGTFLGAKGAK